MKQTNQKINKGNVDATQSGHKNMNLFAYKHFTNRNKSQKIKRIRFDTEAEVANQFLIPLVIQMDKQSMYYEVLRLKIELEQIHNINTQNLKQKSKIKMLEKENQKWKVIQDSTFLPFQKDNKQFQRLFQSLKDRIRQQNTEYQYLESQYKSLKMSVKRTKMAELQSEIVYLQEQCLRLKNLIIELNNQKEQFIKEKQVFIKSQQILKQKGLQMSGLQQELSKSEKICRQYFQIIIDLKKKIQLLENKKVSDNSSPMKINKLPRKEENTPQFGFKQKNSFARRSMDIYQRKLFNNSKIEKEDARQLLQKIEKLQILLEQKQLEIKQLTQKLQIQQQKNIELEKTNQEYYMQESKVISNLRKSIAQQNTSVLLYSQHHNNVDNNKKNVDGQKEQVNFRRTESIPFSDKHLVKENIIPIINKQIEEQNEQYLKNSISQIIEFIVFKLKANRILYEKFVEFIRKSKINNIEEFTDFLEKQPFSIRNGEDIDTIISKVSQDDLKESFIKLFPQYIIMKPNDEKLLSKKMSQIIQFYAKQINEILVQYKDDNNMVDFQIIKQLFQKLELTNQEINYAISKISLTSIDIHHLNYKQLFQLLNEEDYDNVDSQKQQNCD